MTDQADALAGKDRRHCQCGHHVDEHNPAHLGCEAERCDCRHWHACMGDLLTSENERLKDQLRLEQDSADNAIAVERTLAERERDRLAEDFNYAHEKKRKAEATLARVTAGLSSLVGYVAALHAQGAFQSDVILQVRREIDLAKAILALALLAPEGNE